MEYKSLAGMVVCQGIHRIVVGDGKFLVQKTNQEDNTVQASRDNTESAQVYGMKIDIQVSLCSKYLVRRA
jgi:hypothetical protein